MNRCLRLRRSEDFARLRREGQVYRHSLMIVSVAPNGLPHNRYGFITAKRLGNAVRRNRIRRLLREAVRHQHPAVKPGYDLVFIARPHVVGQPFNRVQDAVRDTLNRAALTLQTHD